MIEQVTASIALGFMLIFFVILFYIESGVKQIFKEVECDEKPRFLYAKIKYIHDRKILLAKPLQKKVDRIIFFRKVIYSLFVCMFCLYLIGNIFK